MVCGKPVEWLGWAATFTACAMLLTPLVTHVNARFPSQTQKHEKGTENITRSDAANNGENNQVDTESKIRRLDPHVRPLLYQLTLQPFLGEGTNFTFHGYVSITFTIEEGAKGDSVVLHTKQLNISSDEISINIDENRGPGKPMSSSNTQKPPVPTVTKQLEDPLQETYTLSISPPLVPSHRYILHIPFRGVLQVSTLAGFFRIPYDENGITKWIALTHFEATEARSAFPCFDEPAFKARFKISIKHSTNYSAVSNMPIIHSEIIEDEPGWIVDHFDTSPPMSTYIVTFTVSEMLFETVSQTPLSVSTITNSYPFGSRPTAFTSTNGEGTTSKKGTNVTGITFYTHSILEQISNSQISPTEITYASENHKANMKRSTEINMKHPIKIRVLLRPQLRYKAKYILTVAPKLLKFYEEYFGTPYPLPKLDFTSIPGFVYGGMENWGAITIQETRALIGPETRSDNWQTGAITIVHEFGHQWFGDLITPIWWSETWLREGFATFLEYVGTNFIEPTWEMTDKFLTAMYRVMDEDSTPFTHPTFTTVETVSQIIGVFDTISYSKGACLYRMVNHSITEDVFKRGLSIFVNKWKFLNVNHDELWWSMEQALKQSTRHEYFLPHNTTLKQVMDSWLLQPGFPVVTAIRNYKTGSITISQTRFFRDGNFTTNNSTEVWYIPVSYATQSEITMGMTSTLPRIWLGVNNGKQTVTIENVFPSGNAGVSEWLLLNLQQSGYYKVNYDMDNWKLLSQQLATNPLLLPASTRAQLISDALSLARAGSLPYNIALNITRYLHDTSLETNLVPWQTFLDGMQYLKTGLAPTRTYLPLKKYILSVLVPVIGRLRIEQQPHDTLPIKQLRSQILSELIWLQSYNVWAQTMFAQWMASPHTFKIPADLRPIVFCAAIMKGDDSEFYFVMAQLNNTSDESQHNDLVTSLMCTQQPTLITMLLNAPLDGKFLDIQDAPTVWNAVPKNPAAQGIAFDYIKQNWTNLINRFPNTDYPINDMLQGATAGLNTQKQFDELKEFETSHSGQFNYTSTTLQKAIVNLKELISWRQKFDGDIAEWLQSVVPVSSK